VTRDIAHIAHLCRSKSRQIDGFHHFALKFCAIFLRILRDKDAFFVQRNKKRIRGELKHRSSLPEIHIVGVKADNLVSDGSVKHRRDVKSRKYLPQYICGSAADMKT